MQEDYTKYYRDGKRLIFTYDYDSRERLHDTPIEYAVAAAIVAKELNKHTYLKKDDVYGIVTKKNQDGVAYNSQEVVKTSNKDIIIGLLSYYKDLVNDKLPEATEMVSSLQLDFMFKALTDDAEGYEGSVLKIIAKPTVNINDLGIVAYIPFYHETQEKERAFKERISQSKHLGREGDKLKLAIENISVRRINGDNYSGWTITAVANDGDLVSFFTTKEELTQQVGYYAVSAKVKSLQKDWKYKEFDETRLSYVSKIL